MSDAIQTDDKPVHPAPPAPRATYRLQFHRDFTFAQAAAIVPYLARLGISHVYASPIFSARPGSAHGYDIVDHAAINPELGGREGFVELTDALRQHGMGLLLDIVPNHMGVGGADNGWWLSVLEWGRNSPHAAAFDIDWERNGADGKLVVPFLAERYGEALENGHLELKLDPEAGTLSIWHYEHRCPLNPLTYPIILDRALLLAGSFTEPGFREALAVSSRLRILADAGASAGPDSPHDESETLKSRLAAALAASPALAEALLRTVALINGASGIPDSFETLHRILEAQAYRLAYWRVAASEINYRRFFDVNSLAGIRVEDPKIFEATHRALFDLVDEGRIQGLRIDHIDGLADPAGYLAELQAAVGPGFYILVEKILGPDEKLLPWPVSGTTGYEALNLIDGVLVERGAAHALDGAYREASGVTDTFATLLRQARRATLEGSFASELEVLVSDLSRITQGDRHTRDYTVHGMRRALVEIIERFPVYRSYVIADAASADDRRLIGETVTAAREATALAEGTLHDFIGRVLLAELPRALPGSAMAEHCERFRRRFQQLTGPVMAKSLEDTLFYRYGPLLGLNEVGGEPQHFGVERDAFHMANAARRQDWPQAMIASATHDTKRGEDGRARLLALSEIPDDWVRYARSWQASSRELTPDPALPDRLDRHLILQQLLASFPLALCDTAAPGEIAAFRERMQAWVEKALREAKRHTSWNHPRENYEAAAKQLVAAALEPESRAFAEIRELASELGVRGMIKSLSRTVVKYAVPGVPDTYQGTEFWDFSLVDPDNRRPVDFTGREAALGGTHAVGDLMANWHDGRIKQHVIARLLGDRRNRPQLYALGDYKPAQTFGARADDLVAFVRTCGTEQLLVVATRVSPAQPQGPLLPSGGVWNGTMVDMPAGTWRDILSGAEITVGDTAVPVDDLFQALPVAALRRL